MRFGLFGINFGACADPDVQRRVALAAEEVGFESIWTGEHVAMPIVDSPVPAPAETPFLDSIVASLARGIPLATKRPSSNGTITFAGLWITSVGQCTW